jgi:hypothetical protein
MSSINVYFAVMDWKNKSIARSWIHHISVFGTANPRLECILQTQEDGWHSTVMHKVQMMQPINPKDIQNNNKNNYFLFIFFLASISAALRVVDLGTLRSLFLFLTFYLLAFVHASGKGKETYSVGIEVFCLFLVCCQTFILLSGCFFGIG